MFQKKKQPKAAVADVPFLQNTSVRLLQKFVEYLFLEYFFVSLDKSILLHRRCLMSKFSGILVMVCRKIFSAFSNETFSKLFPPYARVSLFSHHLAFYDRKHFYSILTDSKSSLCWVMIWKMSLQNTFQKCKGISSQMFFKIGVLNLQVSRPATLLKKRPQYMFFYVNIIKFFITAFIWNTSGGCLWKWSKN